MAYFVGWCLLATFLAWLFGRLLRTAHYHGAPKDAARFFVRLEDELKRAHPDVELVGATNHGFGAILRIGRQEMAIPLGEVFLRERAFPDAFAQTVGRLVAEIREHLAALDDLPFDEALQRILPQIRTEEWVRNNSPAFGPGRVLQKPLFDELVVCYVLDEPGSMVFVTQGHLETWGSREDYVDNIAMANLEKLANEQGGLPVPEGADSEPCVLHTGDGYDAARILLALDERRLEATRGLVFAIPDRDTLVVGRKGDGLARLMGEVGEEFEKSPHPISPRVFEVEAKGLRSVEAAEASPELSPT